MAKLTSTPPERGFPRKGVPAYSRSDLMDRFLAREKRLQLVVKELGHRTKNLLTVIQAIASQTLQHSSDLSAFQSEFSQRLDALSRSLDLLIHQGEGGVSLDELVRRQLEPFVTVDGTRVVVTGPDAMLDREATQNLGLALHELATNATKYGALSVPEGAISVRWYLAPGNGGGKRFRLVWREENGPAVTRPLIEVSAPWSCNASRPRHSMEPQRMILTLAASAGRLKSPLRASSCPSGEDGSRMGPIVSV